MMPESTPIYGFTYPCPGEVVSAASFTVLANQIDAKLVDVNNDLTAALNRRNFYVNGSGTQAIPAGADTVLTIPGMTYVIPEAGVWIVRAAVFAQSSPATNMMRTRVRQNGVVRFAFTQNTEGGTLVPPIAFGPMVAAVGDTVTVAFLYNGLGTMDVSGNLSAKMIVRIP